MQEVIKNLRRKLQVIVCDFSHKCALVSDSVIDRISFLSCHYQFRWRIFLRHYSRVALSVFMLLWALSRWYNSWLTCKKASAQSQVTELTDMQESKCSVTGHAIGWHARKPVFIHSHIIDWHAREPGFSQSCNWLTCKIASVQSQSYN
jgi:hypothetical protein